MNLKSKQDIIIASLTDMKETIMRLTNDASYADVINAAINELKKPIIEKSVTQDDFSPLQELSEPSAMITINANTLLITDKNTALEILTPRVNFEKS